MYDNLSKFQLGNVEDVEAWAVKAHKNQKYGDKPYVYHLRQVAVIIEDYYPRDSLLWATAWLHDTIEDTDVTREDIAKRYGNTVASDVWACTGVGKNRKEKQASILQKLTENPRACPVKVADRIANLAAGIAENRKDKFEMYLAEHEAFREVVKDHVLPVMLNDLDVLILRGKEHFNV